MNLSRSRASPPKLAGCTYREIGMRVGHHTSSAFRDVKDHLELGNASRHYAVIAAAHDGAGGLGQVRTVSALA